MPRILENIFLLPFRVEPSPKGQVLLLKIRVRYAFGQFMCVFALANGQTKIAVKFPGKNVLIFIFSKPLHEGPNFPAWLLQGMRRVGSAPPA